MIYAVIYQNRASRAIRFIGAYHTLEKAKGAMQEEMKAYWCEYPHRFETCKSGLSSRIMIQYPDSDKEWFQGVYEILPQV